MIGIIQSFGNVGREIACRAQLILIQKYAVYPLFAGGIPDFSGNVKMFQIRLDIACHADVLLRMTVGYKCIIMVDHEKLPPIDEFEISIHFKRKKYFCK